MQTQVRLCIFCRNPIPPERKSGFCSSLCNHKFGEKQRKDHEAWKINPVLSKKVAEYAVIHDLLSLNFDVFVCVSPNSSCDLLIAKNDEAHKVEIRCGYQAKSGRVFCNRPPKRVQDPEIIYAMVVDGHQITYDPPLLDIVGKSSIPLSVKDEKVALAEKEAA